MAVGVLAFVGALVFGALHGFAVLRGDFSGSKPSVEAQAGQPSPRPNIGNNNTIVGVPPPASLGSNNTIVGPTDNRGNTIINQGGTTIGAGACGDSTSVVIGAGAHQKGCAPPTLPDIVPPDLSPPSGH